LNYKAKLLNLKGKIFAVAPMMDWTDRHCRMFHRTLTRRALLYTEMITAQAIRHGDHARLLGFDPREKPVALQIGGSEPKLLAEAAKWGEEFGYDEINLNVGCPSDRVQEGRFGACLMAEPRLVAECVAAMRKAVGLPVTVKCRLGIDEQDTEESLDQFVKAVQDAGCQTLIVHARKAWLKGLSPKENREIPPLDHCRVHRLKSSFPELNIILNGGMSSLNSAVMNLQHVDGVMLGRAAYRTPFLLADVDSVIYGDPPDRRARSDVVADFRGYIAEELARGTWLSHLTRHMLGLFHGIPGGRQWRRILSEEAHRKGAGLAVLDHALAAVRDNVAIAAAA
jgi:tRNA-dihydrouridine synthase A